MSGWHKKTLNVSETNFIRIRKFFYEEQHRSCFYCEKQLTVRRFKNLGNELSFDHLLPKNKGGENKISNFIGACVSCNSKKSDNHYQNFFFKFQHSKFSLEDIPKIQRKVAIRFLDVYLKRCAFQIPKVICDILPIHRPGLGPSRQLTYQPARPLEENHNVAPSSLEATF